MSRFFDYDPVTGMQEIQDWDDDGRVTVHQQEDVEALVNQCRTNANHGLTDAGIKQNFWHYADIPMTVVLELRKKGINVFDKNCTQALFRELNQNYPYLKNTSKTHA